MSDSDEGAFASAEEGEEGRASATRKTTKGTRKNRGAAKAGGKQKVKQPSKEGKGMSKIASEQNAKLDQKTASSGESLRKEELGSWESKTVKTSDIKSASASDPEAPQDSATISTEASDKERHDKKDHLLQAEKDSKKQAFPENIISEENANAEVKSAGQIRQNLTAVSEMEKPTEQAIPRDFGSSEPERVTEKAEKMAGKGDSWNWGWGSSLLNAATNSLETFSSQVGEGLSTLIDTVESSLGVPDPASIARVDSATELSTEPNTENTVTDQPHEKEAVERTAQETAEQAKSKTEDEDKGRTADSVTEEKEEEEKRNAEGGGSWLSGWGSNITNMGKTLVNKSQNLMNTGFEKAEHLAAGGLDILETIGRKTYSTLTEHDPGLRRAREFLNQKSEKPSLSSILKEAQEQAEQKAKHDEEMEEARKCNFTAMFEDNQGLAHLEALEMLSNRSERKVQALLSAMEDDLLETIRPQLMEIKDTFQQACGSEKEREDTEHEFSKLVTENLSDLHLGTAPDKLNKVQETVRQWIADFYSHEDHSEISSPKEVQQRAIQSLADVTSKAVEQFHKAGELVLLQKDEDKTFLHRAQSLAKLASVLVTEVDILATKFSQCLNKIGEEKGAAEDVTTLVTSVYLEASNASSYIQDAFQLLLPVLQHAAIQAALTSGL